MILESSHIEWLNLPVTRAAVKILDKQIELITNKIANNSMSTDVSNETIRHLAVQLKTLKTLKEVTYDTTTFIAKSN